MLQQRTNRRPRHYTTWSFGMPVFVAESTGIAASMDEAAPAAALAWLLVVERGMPALPRSRPGLASLPFMVSDLDKRDENRMLT